MYFFQMPYDCYKKKKEILVSSYLSTLYNIFFYILLVFAFDLQKGFGSYFILLQKKFLYCSRPYLGFLFFLLQKDFDTIHVSIFEMFLSSFDNIQLVFSYTWKIYLTDFLLFYKYSNLTSMLIKLYVLVKITYSKLLFSLVFSLSE